MHSAATNYFWKKANSPFPLRTSAKFTILEGCRKSSDVPGWILNSEIQFEPIDISPNTTQECYILFLLFYSINHKATSSVFGEDLQLPSESPCCHPKVK